MRKIKKYTKFLLLVVCCFFYSLTVLYAQTSPVFFTYQGVARDSSGQPLVNHLVSLKIGILSGSSAGELQWEETHPVTTDKNGFYEVAVGAGTTTGNGLSTSLISVPWENNMFLQLSVDFTGGNDYTYIGTTQLFSSPYSFYSAKTDTPAKGLGELPHVDTTTIQNNRILKWDGLKWIVANDNDADTVTYALNTITVKVSDTASYLRNGAVIKRDSVPFAFRTNNASYSKNTSTVDNVNATTESDTAVYAKTFLLPNWSIGGNTGRANDFIGTVDSNSLLFKTNALERMRITAAGQTGFSTMNPLATFQSDALDGLSVTGAFGSGESVDSSAGTKLLWYPKKAAFCFGQVTANNWTDASIGEYSFAAGLNPVASDIFAIAMGINSTASSESCIAIGKTCTSKILGVVSDGAAVVMGDSCASDFTRGIAMGIKCFVTSPGGGIAMGYKNTGSGASASAAFGTNTVASGLVSIALGSYASNNALRGTFIYGDASTTTTVKNTVANQFLVRASGGVKIYSDTLATMAVEIQPGAGAWSTVVDRQKIENLKNEDENVILKKITDLKIKNWNYKAQDKSIRHIGPTAQDFYAAFSLGDNSTSISTTDMDGVILLGIKALEKRTSLLMNRINSISEAPLKAKEEFQSIEERIRKIEQAISN